MNALTVACPACMAPAGKPCTAPTNTGRRIVRWTHLAREEQANTPTPTTGEHNA